MSVSSSQPIETNKNTNDYLSQPNARTDLNQMNNQNSNQVQIKLDDLSAALLPLLSNQIQETITTQLTNQFQCMNLTINANLEKINYHLTSIDQKHDCLENDMSKVTTAIKEMKLEQSSTQAKVDNLEKTVEENQQTIADLRAEIQLIAGSKN